MNAPRTEYHVMQGSVPDVTTEAGRQLMDQVAAMDSGAMMTDGAPYDGRGFLDPSDRLYLVEQAQAGREKEERERALEKDAVRSFYEFQRKEGAKPRLQEVPDLVEKPVLPTTAPIVIVPKKKKKTTKRVAAPKAAPRAKKTKTTQPALVGYGSSSESESESPKSRGPPIALSEEFCMDIATQLKELMNDPSIPHVVFPSSLDNTERRYIHTVAKKYGLFSKSKGKGDDRFIHVSRAKTTVNMETISLRISPAPLSVSMDTLQEMQDVLALDAPSPDRAQMAMPPPFRKPRAAFKSAFPPVAPPHKYTSSQRALPAHAHRDEILALVQKHQVVVVAGDTGCGKSTQLPQFLMDAPGPARRIVVTQPRRISAITLAERISDERSLEVGKEVGYCIRLDAKYSHAATQLIFATTGTLLRWLGSDPLGKQFTHIVVDEVHERDKDTDFLLVVLKLILPLRPDLRVILMSATIQVDKFSAYFNQCPIVSIQGRMHPVQACFLDDVLLLLDSSVPSSKTKASTNERPKKKQRALDASCVMCGKCDFADEGDFGMHVATCFGGQWVPPTATPDEALLLSMPADEDMEAPVDDAVLEGSVCDQVARRLAAKRAHAKPSVIDNLVSSYQLSQDALGIDGGVDVDLVVRLLGHLMSVSYGEGAILVFLPGWDDIQAIADVLDMQPVFRKCMIAILHSRLSPQEQKRAFARPPKGARKIILATNIAETSVTIEDVVYVIDTCKSKQSKLINGYSALHTEWVSDANCKQRRGRAGRVAPGVCFHLLTRQRFESLPAFLTPELLTTSLEDSVLAIQMLQWQSGDSLGFESIGEFLSLAPDPPLTHVVEGAIASLQALGALNSDESLTYLGWELSQMSLSPAIAKTLLLSTFHDVAAPILYSACALSYREPFESELGTSGAQRNQRRLVKASLASGHESDHWVLYAAIYGFLLASDRDRSHYCRANGLLQPVLFHTSGVIKQIEVEFTSLGYAIPPPMGPPSPPMAMAVLASGLYPNLMYRDVGSVHYTTKDKFKVRRAGASVLSPKKPTSREWVVFHDMMQTEHARTAQVMTKVHPFTLALLVGASAVLEELPDVDDDDKKKDDDEDEAAFLDGVIVVIDGWIALQMEREVATLVLRLRQRLSDAFLNYVAAKSHASLSPADAALLHAVASWVGRETQR
ncbi:hypothetical protein SPRG_06558 [Saprolegnia parasitica CBS 223.65]|uniref:Uncharacterized protein n=1 Tax=Saprolegnia parasitica (strain CBS 223.65) TaxID=695850 RepID=A0A067CDA2_SAPPC|nr:hypothetical protein SPRG_06558 [Saprolegnia parasitica CBS 223.65]KDO28704.1 hypothetical protein SPRG_06558 [Saprolegnia parasitica CBS 223.65]|eukprot:XP_012200762.1 hypothetical protein SPRG_06558 [Saprolegnia parasitica CBS 223.65]